MNEAERAATGEVMTCAQPPPESDAQRIDKVVAELSRAAALPDGVYFAGRRRTNPVDCTNPLIELRELVELCSPSAGNIARMQHLYQRTTDVSVVVSWTWESGRVTRWQHVRRDLGPRMGLVRPKLDLTKLAFQWGPACPIGEAERLAYALLTTAVESSLGALDARAKGFDFTAGLSVVIPLVQGFDDLWRASAQEIIAAAATGVFVEQARTAARLGVDVANVVSGVRR